MIGPTLEELLDQAVTSRLQSVYTSLPGRVLAFSPATSTASVQPFPAIYQDGAAVDLPVLHGVPVSYPSGNGASITWPVASGDVVLLLFASAPLSRYRTEGAEGDPDEARRFDLTDAWAVPLAGGSQPAATSGRLVVTQPTLGKVQVGAGGPTPAAARVGDSVSLTIDAVTGAALQSYLAAAAAWVAGGSIPPPPPPFTLSAGSITSGSSVVEVA